MSGWVRDRWDRLLAAAIAVVGVAMLLLGWFGVSDARLTTQQLPYLASGGLGGLFALGVACTLWLSADMRDEFAKLDQLHQLLEGHREESSALAEVSSNLDVVSTSTSVRPRTKSAQR